MRGRLFGWMTGAAVVASCVAGCSGGGANNTSYTLPDYNPSASRRAFSYTIPEFKSSDKAIVVASTVGRDEYDTSNCKVLLSGSARSAYAPSLTATPEEDKDEEFDERSASLNHQGYDMCGFSRSGSQPMARLQRGECTVKDLKATAGIGAWGFDTMAPGTMAEMYGPLKGAAAPLRVSAGLDNSDVLNPATKYCNIVMQWTPDEDGVYGPAFSTEVARKVADIFDSSNPYDPSEPGKVGIYERLTSYIGHEWKQGGGIDGDKRVNIVLCTSDAMGDETSTVFGLVRYDDLFANNDYTPTSNQGEFIYLNIGALVDTEHIDTADLHFLCHTLTHEFSHLIHCNQKICTDGSYEGIDSKEVKEKGGNLAGYEAMEFTTLAEGMAETTTNLLGLGVSGAQNDGSDGKAAAVKYSYDNINQYLGGTSVIDGTSKGITQYPTPFFAATNSSDSVNPYGMGHLFGLYILQHYGRDKYCRLYTDSTKIGIENLEEVLGDDFESVLHNYDLSLALSGLEGCPSMYSMPYINIGGLNYYMDGNSVVSHTLNSTSAIFEEDAWGATHRRTDEPWSPMKFLFKNGNGEPFKALVELPKKGNVHVIHVRDDEFLEFVDGVQLSNK